MNTTPSPKPEIFIAEGGNVEYAKKLSKELNLQIIKIYSPDKLLLYFDENGTALSLGKERVYGDFTKMLPRLKKSNLFGELVVKAAKIKGMDSPLNILDATAGMGEDSLILAAAGHNVTLYEYDPIIASLLEDTLKRAEKNPCLSDAVSRMKLNKCDSIKAMANLSYTPDVILLDPMFPERKKSALVKKKFQLIHNLEKPCENEKLLLDTAMSVKAKKIIIKRPVKGAYLADVKPSYSITGKSVRYDCIV